MQKTVRQLNTVKMATDQAYITETIAQIAAVVVKAVVQATSAERGDGDECTRHRDEDAGVRPKLDGPSPTFKFTKEVKSTCQTHDIDKAENIQVLKKMLCRQALIQTEQKECNEIVKSLPIVYTN